MGGPVRRPDGAVIRLVDAMDEEVHRFLSWARDLLPVGRRLSTLRRDQQAGGRDPSPAPLARPAVAPLRNGWLAARPICPMIPWPGRSFRPGPAQRLPTRTHTAGTNSGVSVGKLSSR